MNKKGFTLVELLASLIIMAIIALITVPTVSKTIENARESSNIRSIEDYVDAAKMFYAGLSEDEGVSFDTNILAQLDVKNARASAGYIMRNEDGDIYFGLIINNKCYYSGETSDKKDIKSTTNINICKNDKTIYLADEQDPTPGDSDPVPDGDNPIIGYVDHTLNGADPVLSKGMIPIHIADDGTVTKASIKSNWYDYANKKWANVVLVKETTRDTYQNAADNTNIKLEDILAYYVWIPRFKYQLFSSYDVEEINVEFESAKASKSISNTVGDWLTHPAFTFDGKELNGIWIGKFETTGTKNNPTVLPGLHSLIGLYLSEEFEAAQKFNSLNTYGIDNDAHITKNSEWGAVAYLSNSKYGRCNNGTCDVIRRNNNINMLTGYSAVNESTTGYLDESSSENEFGVDSSITKPYNTSIGYLASTTGNISGVYDMAGGTGESVLMLVHSYENSEIKYLLGNAKYTIDNFPNGKYYQNYEFEDSCKEGVCNGDALEETYNWYTYSSWYLTTEDYPYFYRGAWYNCGDEANVFQFADYDGGAYLNITFRTVLVN